MIKQIVAIFFEILLLFPCFISIQQVGKQSVSYLVNNGKHRFVSRVSYDGTLFHGFQEQVSKVRTVQGTISNVLSKRFSKSVKITGASRTDYGVHARGQVIHFDLDPGLLDDIPHVEYTLNRMLPEDIKLYNISYAPLGTDEQASIDDIFHATKSAEGKLYMYRFCTNRFVDPLLRHRYAHFYRPIDIELLRRSLSRFVGTHDFSAFGNGLERLAKSYIDNNWHSELSTVRTIHRIELIEEGQGYYRIEFYITSALYRMIRNIVGTCQYVASGLLEEDYLMLLLQTGKSRKDNLAKSAEAHGLCLEKVYYRNY